ncbi:MAG TPA: stage III sporulation protein AE [Papillibacter sp.]|jgi:stage III sporulation protein AE|nr:stage III sporulation protein AE [Papillibacter sp.]
MKKWIVTLIASAALVLLCGQAASAQAGQAVTSPLEAADAYAEELKTDRLEDALPDDARDLLGNFSVSDATNPKKGLGTLLSALGGRARQALTAGLKNAIVVMLTALLCGMLTASFDNAGRYAVLAGVLAISMLSIQNVGSFVGLGREVLNELNLFTKALLPTLTSAAAASGAVTSAAAKYAAAALFMDILMTASHNIVIPIIYAFTATSVAEAALGGEGLTGASNLLKWLGKTTMSFIMLLFVAYLSITGVISASTDAAAVKAMKTTIQTVLPVVGSIIADASDTVLAGAQILRNAIGVFGFIAVAATCAGPFIVVGVHYLAYKAAAGLAASASDGRITKLIANVSAAFGMILGLIGCSALMLYISIISVIRMVS